MFRTIEDFLNEYQQLNERTIKIFSELADSNLKKAVKAGYRNLGQLAWHIVVTVPEMMGRTGLPVSSVDQEARPPKSAMAILKGYKQVSKELIEAIKSQWTDETLLQTDDMYGEAWMRGKTLFSLITHEIHHVGQMTVLLRQAGAQVPGLYGPSKEEWSQFGMQPPSY
jgi:uncharacterized damage-inducible protein DinB